MALFFILPTDLPFNNDQNSYLGGAAALKAGHGYRLEQYIDLPPIGTYSPGYSLWLALFWKNGQPISANAYRLEIANWLAAGAALTGLAGCLFISELPALAGWTLLMSLGASLVFTQFTFGLMSDVLFTAGICALTLLVTAYGGENSDHRLTIWWFCASLLVGLLCFLKVAALAFAAGLGAYGLWKGDLRRPSRLACFVLPPAVMALWFFHTKGVQVYASSLNVSQVGGLGAYVLQVAAFALLYGSERWFVTDLLNLPDRLPLAHAFQHFSSVLEGLLFLLGLALFAIPTLLGLRKRPRQPQDRIALFLLGAYFIELIFWPYHDGPRFGMAAIPLLFTFLWRGLPSKAARTAFVIILAVNIPGNAWLSYKIIRAQEKESIQSLADLRLAAVWINQSGGSSSRVAAGRDVPVSHLYEFLGRRMLANPGPGDQRLTFDVSPRAQGDLAADYIVSSSSFAALGPHYRIKARFGNWIVWMPN